MSVVCESASIDPDEEVLREGSRRSYPFCIVWSPLPIITILLPFIGHMGITDSNGIIYDFAGSYTINRGNMAFGAPTRYLRVVPEAEIVSCPSRADAWDEAVKSASREYARRPHKLIFDNCHSHVALAMNSYRYDDSTSYNMVKLAFWMFFMGRFVNFYRFLYTVMPSLFLALCVIFVAVFLTSR